MRTNYVKVKTDKTQQNSKCRLCGDRDETIDHKISGCSKLAQKEYKIRHERVGKVIYWELCKKLNFYQPIKRGLSVMIGKCSLDKQQKRSDWRHANVGSSLRK